jgi:hypothetical protein
MANMASMVALRPLAALPSSRCAAARPQAMQWSRVSAANLDPQAGATPELPHSKGGAGSKGADAHSQQSEKCKLFSSSRPEVYPLSSAPMQGFPNGRRISLAATGCAAPGGPTDPEPRPSGKVHSKLDRDACECSSARLSSRIGTPLPTVQHRLPSVCTCACAHPTSALAPRRARHPAAAAGLLTAVVAAPPSRWVGGICMHVGCQALARQQPEQQARQLAAGSAARDSHCLTSKPAAGGSAPPIPSACLASSPAGA